MFTVNGYSSVMPAKGAVPQTSGTALVPFDLIDVGSRKCQQDAAPGDALAS